MAAILVIEDEQNIAKLIKRCLEESEGHRCHLAPTGRNGLELFEQVAPDAVVLDLMLPDINGREVCERIRESSFRRAKLPPAIVMLSAKDSPADRAIGYDVGANVYLCKPFEPQELAACLRAQLRQRRHLFEREQSKVISTPHFQIDPEQRVARMRCSFTQVWHPLDLSSLELNLLTTLASRSNRVWSRSQLIDQVWDLGSGVSERSVDSVIKRLRAKIFPEGDRFIRTIPGVGYKFEDVAEHD
ncbi:response regulator transcription factor [Leptolyngbya sp. FACHB-16]|nr:response regulator transcription factor [Leptolyngbya sp. FACHB-16]